MNFYRKEIFPISIYHSSVEDHKRLKSLIMPFINNAIKDRGVDNKPPDGWLTDNLITSFSDEDVRDSLFNPDNNMGKELRYQFLKVLDSFFLANPWQIDVEHIWYNYYVNGEWQESHKHLGGLTHAHFAFVYLVSYNPKIHSPLVFNDPLETHRSISPRLDPNENDGKYFVKAKEGDVIMFPTWLEHHVRPGKPTPNYPRISIAMNIKMQRYGDMGSENEG